MNPSFRYSFIYGALSGIISIIVIVAGLTVADRISSFASMWFGYLVMLVALSFVFVGTKRFRDVERGGVIEFGPAFAIGIGITIVASIIYVLVWEAYLWTTGYAFIDQYFAGILKARQAAGLSGAALAEEAAKLETMRAQYRDPLLRLPMTFLEIFPVGLVVALIAAGLLRNPRFLPARI